jgi:hypothetical protein
MTPYDDIAAQGPQAAAEPLIDGFGRTVTYLRLSVTDRCDLRCIYCMAEHMTFLPKAEVLTLEELDRIATAFVTLGTTKLRLTGGEPLMRKGMLDLVRGSAATWPRRAAGTDPQHQRHPPARVRRRTGRGRRAAGQRLHGHPEALTCSVA